MKKNNKQRQSVKIVKNKEIIVYKNGKKYKRFKQSETKSLKENEIYILDYLLNKYKGYEVDLESEDSEDNDNINNNNNNFELNSNEEFSQSNIKRKNSNQSYEEEDEENIESNKLKQSKNNKNKRNNLNNKEENLDSSISINSKKVKNKTKSNKLDDDEEEEEEEIIIKGNKKTGKAKGLKNKKKKKNQSYEEEEEEMEENIESDDNENIRTKNKKNKKNKKRKKKVNDSEDEDESEDEEDGGGEEIIKRRIIKRTKESNNKNPKQSITKVIHGDVVEIKHTNKNIKTKTKKSQKKPKKIIKKEKNDSNEDNNENDNIIDVEIEEKKNNFKKAKSEIIPQYITQLQSYTSPTIKNIDEKKAEETVLNGITSSIFINGKEIKGILFLARNNILCFIPSDGEDKDREIDIVLENIKKIYFNVKGGPNMKNYEKKNDEERFIKLVEINDDTKDIKFNNEEDFELFIKGLILVFKNKTNGINKNIIYNIVRSTLKNHPGSEEKNNKHVEEKIDNYEDNNNYQNIEENNNENKKENADDDIVITTTITEVVKDGEFINNETREKMDGVVKSLHVYSPDTDEYEVFLKNTKLGQKQLVRRLNDGLPIESVNEHKENSTYNENEICINNNDNENEVKEEAEIKEEEY